MSMRSFLDLIDTLWNVKPDSLPAASASPGFNRYIVECKESMKNCLVSAHADLIDTLWNVKRGSPCRCSLLQKDLIDTLWNVKATAATCTDSAIRI